MATFDHQDILDLIASGQVARAKELISRRSAQNGISGEDMNRIKAALPPETATK
jgi:hypothetical protein